jgi:hypothetical protein
MYTPSGTGSPFRRPFHPRTRSSVVKTSIPQRLKMRINEPSRGDPTVTKNTSLMPSPFGEKTLGTNRPSAGGRTVTSRVSERMHPLASVTVATMVLFSSKACWMDGELPPVLQEMASAPVPPDAAAMNEPGSPGHSSSSPEISISKREGASRSKDRVVSHPALSVITTL